MALTMIGPAFSCFEIMELPIVNRLSRQTVNSKELLTPNKIFDKTLYPIAKLVNNTWLCRYPWYHHLIYNNRSEFKLHFDYLCKSYGITRKPTMVKKPQADAILGHMHQLLGQMLAQLKLIWPNQLPPMTSMSFLITRHGQFALPILQYSKPHQVQPFLDETCSLTFRLWLTGTKLESTGNH
jgi:hypothetical protein